MLDAPAKLVIVSNSQFVNISLTAVNLQPSTCTPEPAAVRGLHRSAE